MSNVKGTMTRTRIRFELIARRHATAERVARLLSVAALIALVSACNDSLGDQNFDITEGGRKAAAGVGGGGGKGGQSGVGGAKSAKGGSGGVSGMSAGAGGGEAGGERDQGSGGGGTGGSSAANTGAKGGAGGRVGAAGHGGGSGRAGAAGGTGSGGMGAAGQSNGSAGAGACKDLSCSTPAACWACETAKHVDDTMMNCPSSIAMCEMAMGVAQSGPRVGAKKSSLCMDLVNCIHRTNCAQASFGAEFGLCLCGGDPDTFDQNHCLNMPDVNSLTGACKNEIVAAAESDKLTDIANRLTDPTYASGLAEAVIDSCDDFYCSYECNTCSHSSSTCVPNTSVASDAGAGGEGATAAGASGTAAGSNAAGTGIAGAAAGNGALGGTGGSAASGGTG